MIARVLFVNHTSVLGGAELFLLDLVKGWQGKREVVLFADGPLRQRLEREMVPVRVLAAHESVNAVGRTGRGLAQLRAIPGVWQLACQIARRAADFDLIFANSQKALVVGTLAAWMTGKKLVWYLHDILTADHFSALNRRVSVTLGNRCAKRVIANSEASRQAFIASGGCAERTAVVYNGINAASESESEIAAAALQVRKELGWNGAKVVGVFSRLSPWKGQHVLLDALRKIPGLHAIFVGAPLFGDDLQYQRELEARVETLGLTQRVRFLGFRADMPALLQAVDCVAHTSVSPEPFGRVIVEGMLAGKPVVAMHAGGACEIIEDRVTGRLVRPADADALAEVLRGFIEHPEEATRLGQAGQVFARKRFSIETMMRGIEHEVSVATGLQDVEV